MSRLLVIGMGSLLMRDDGIGSLVAQQLEPRLQMQDIKVIVGETDTAYCFHAIGKRDILILIDAMQTGEEPGTVAVIPLGEALQNRSRLRTQHECSLLDSIALHYPDAQGVLIGIEAPDVSFGYGLSPFLEQRFHQICETIIASIIQIKEEKEYARHPHD